MSAREEEAVFTIVKKMLDNGAIDELVIATLESALNTAFDELRNLESRPYLEPHHWQDWADSVEFAFAAIKVLQYFSTDQYESELEEALHYSKELRVLEW